MEKITQKILKVFLYHNKLKFSEIEKLVKIRSNKLSYYIKQLVRKGILEQEDKYYKLSSAAEHMIPYLSDKKQVLPVILIHLGNKQKVFLYKRNKRPFKNKLSLPGGRIVFKENIKSAVKRIMKEKFNINATLKNIHSVSVEQICKSKKIIQTDLVIFVSAKTKMSLNFVDVEVNKKFIIKSDYNFIRDDLEKEVKIKEIFTGDKS